MYGLVCYFFFFNDTATTEIYTLSLHDALPIFKIIIRYHLMSIGMAIIKKTRDYCCEDVEKRELLRSEEHTSELQSRQYLVCRLLLEKKKNNNKPFTTY